MDEKDDIFGEIEDVLKMMKGVINRPKSIGREESGGFLISTIFATDLEVYETAIIDQNDTYPVERYKELSEAEAGHKKWKEAALSLDGKSVTKLGFGVSVRDEQVVLKKMSAWTKSEKT